ncbi:MAG: TRAP transporter substrate-binding protein, partial [Akkermansiaceae bacterium]|nr:TRAP transporter substrate-binding protein [Akkermansiaceae bacterium]
MPKGHPTVTQVSLTVPVRFLDVPEPVRAKLRAIGLKPTEIPKSWRGQDAPTQAVDLGTVIITHRRLSDEVAYLFTRTICE